jgi:hypothetical protein
MGDLPQIPSYDVGLGLASAVLLFLATYLLARARTDPRQDAHAYADRSNGALFSAVRFDPSQRGLSFVGSLFAHLLVVAVVPSLQILSHEIPPIRVPRYEIITLDYRMPMPPVVTAAELDTTDAWTAPSEPTLETEKPSESEEEVTRGDREGALEVPARAAAAPERKQSGSAPRDDPQDRRETEGERATVQVLLPEKLHVNPALKDIVIQPDFTIELPKDYRVDLPPVMLWASSPLKLESGAILEPASRSEPIAASLPDLAAQLLPPNDEIALADLQIPALRIAVDEPALTLPPADVVPLAGQNPLADIAPPPSSVGEQGQNSLIALSQQPDLQSSLFELQPGYRLGSIDSSTPSGAVRPGGESSEPSEPGEKEPSDVTGQGEGTGLGDVTDGEGAGDVDTVGDSAGDDASGLIASVHTSGKSGVKIIELRSSGEAGAGDGESGLGEAGEGPGAGGDPNGDPEAEGRLKPLPRSQYGIILVSNTRSEIPEANGVLTGTPVYTVYIDVPDAPRKWVLQYCLPPKPTTAEVVQAGVIRIRSVVRVDPPHALQTQPLRLELPAGTHPPPRVVVYAKVTEEGNLENFRVIRGADPQTDQMVLANLQSWDFHPAFQRGEPVSVEAVFGIPLR